MFEIYVKSKERFCLLFCACVYMCQVFNNHLIFKFWKALNGSLEDNCLITIHNEELKGIESAYSLIGVAVVSIFIRHQCT